MMTRVVSATEFKAKCLAFLADIEQHGKSVTITKRGVPVAVLGPARKSKVWKSTANSLAGKIKIVGDIVNTSDLWNSARRKREP